MIEGNPMLFFTIHRRGRWWIAQEWDGEAARVVSISRDVAAARRAVLHIARVRHSVRYRTVFYRWGAADRLWKREVRDCE